MKHVTIRSQFSKCLLNINYIDVYYLYSSFIFQDEELLKLLVMTWEYSRCPDVVQH